ncbi:Imm19 family immunity protein [Chitinophaga sp. sic0106]|uniref:Imm19 family immunity protein n=1 Tax=Chitinophaga sp. sic0106 TaxID=2854785 RepID=UPI001C46B478|nr:Imm19 family immunity protein [Chitinophaga sp. sic0106]MBV7531046.1 immunity protein 19 [Chitinophaga sp. sic0106]
MRWDQNNYYHDLETMELTLSNRNFCLFLLTQFPFASSDDLEIMLSDYLFDHFEMPSGEWLSGLTGTEEEDPWSGYTFAHPLNEQVTLYAEFRPHETVYYFNDTYLGNTGGHFHLSLFSWEELKALTAKATRNESLLFLLLLPLTVGNVAEQAEIEALISQHLHNTSLALNAEQLELITQFLSRHLIFEDHEQNIFEILRNVGPVINRNHSERSRKKEDEALLIVNKAIESALS